MGLGRRTDATGKVVPIHEARKGRGAVSHIAHRFESTQREIDGDALDAALLDGEEELPPLATQVTFEQAGTIIAYNESPDLGFDRSINPYRGCEHGCIYCFARPTHSYLNLSPGLDFETQLVAKRNAAEVLERELAAPKYRAGDPQSWCHHRLLPADRARAALTRSIVEVLARTRHPFSVVTKSSLVERDLDLIGPAAAGRSCRGVLQPHHARQRPVAQARAARGQSARGACGRSARWPTAGVPVHVNVAPLIPFINEPEIEALLEAAKTAGAGHAHYTVVRLPWEVNPLFRSGC